MLQGAIANVQQLKRDERGNVTMMFGLSILALSMMVGMAFDVGRAFASKNKVAAAADAAALAAVKAMRLEGLSVSQAKALARTVFDQNMAHGSARWTDVHNVDITIDTFTATARVDVDATVKTTFAAISGITRMPTPGTSTAQFDVRDVEVGVQLDLTGSMCAPCTKIDDLKAATKDLIDILIPQTPTAQSVRVGLAPFSAGVNVGPYLRAVDGNRSSTNACVYERISPTNATTDVAPIGTDAFKIRSDLTGTVQSCPAAQIVPLSNNRGMLKAQVDTFRTGGSTAGQLGAAWAWNLVSPNWSSVWPAASRPVPYGTANTDKIVILMTDGIYNTIGGVNHGDTSPQATDASNISIELCTNMKAAGITVYTVGFDLDSISNPTARARATDTLRACAGRQGHPNPEEFFYQADNGAMLRDAFNKIATEIMRLRLSN